VCATMFSCNDNFEIGFNELVNVREYDCLNTVSLHGLDDCSQKYKELYLKGAKINHQLIAKAISGKETKYRLCPMSFLLTEGDIALCLLIDINKMDDNEFYKLIPPALISDHKNKGSITWWLWIHEKPENRRWVVDQIQAILDKRRLGVSP
jgi:hypothetical protein